jgi:hypothetical protein
MQLVHDHSYHLLLDSPNPESYCCGLRQDVYEVDVGEDLLVYVVTHA